MPTINTDMINILHKQPLQEYIDQWLCGHMGKSDGSRKYKWHGSARSVQEITGRNGQQSIYSEDNLCWGY